MADSVHEDILTLSIARLAALSLGGMQSRIESREYLDEGWSGNVREYPCLVVSGVGTRYEWEPGNGCMNADAFPLLIRVVDRMSSWNPVRRTLHYQYLQLIVDAFRHKQLALTVSGAHCTDVLLLPSPTLEADPLTFGLCSRPLNFEVRTKKRWP